MANALELLQRLWQEIWLRVWFTTSKSEKIYFISKYKY